MSDLKSKKKDNGIMRMADLCKKAGKCTEGHIALWTGTLGSQAYRIFKQLRDLCKAGLLNDDEYQCVDMVDRIEFIKRGNQ